MKRFTAILTAAASALALCGCSTPPSSEPLSMTGVFFDTIVSIDIWNGTQEILDHCEELCSTYEQMFPLLGTAAIYLVLVMIFTWLLGKLERRLRQSDRR